MRTIEALSEKDLKGKRVLLRVGFDVPVIDGKVTNDFRIREALPTIEYLTTRGARVILLSHIGRKKEETLLPVYQTLTTYMDIAWVPHLQGEDVVKAVNELSDGEVLLLENLRSSDGEATNDEVLAKTLALYGESFVYKHIAV